MVKKDTFSLSKDFIGDGFSRKKSKRIEHSDGGAKDEKNHNVDPIYFHIVLNERKEFNCDVPAGHNSFIYLLKGELKIGNNKHNKTADSNLILLERGTKLKVTASKKSEFLFIAGKPIGEPIARGGPFVMNTKAEILEAIQDYNNGTFAKY